MSIDVYNSHIEVYPYIKGDCPLLEDMYTATEKFSEKTYPCGYMIEDNKLYLPSGMNIARLENLLQEKASIKPYSDPYEEMNVEHESFSQPRDELQERAIAFLHRPESQLALNLITGFGKGQPLWTKIPTPNGYKLLGDLKVNDTIFGSNGYQIKVTDIFDQDIQNVYKITFNDGRVSYCDENHLWNVYIYPSKQTKTIQLKDMLNDFKVYSPEMENESKLIGSNRQPYKFKYRIPILTNPIDYDKQSIPIHPYVLGAFIGNGCLREDGLSISSRDGYVPYKIAKICGFKVKRNSLKNYTYTFYDAITNKCIQTKDFFKDIPEFINTYSIDKTIPENYIYNSIWIRIELLKGLMDTDGHISESEGRFHVSYTSCSKILLEQIKCIIMSLGYNASLSIDKRVEKYTNKFCGTLRLLVPHKFKPFIFSHPKKLNIALKCANLPDVRLTAKYLIIKNIEFVGREKTRCIKVDASNQLYITQDFIITHNTYCVSEAITNLNLKSLIIVPTENIKLQWLQTFTEMFDYKKKQIMNLANSQIMNQIYDGTTDYSQVDIFIVNHGTFHSYISQFGGYQFHEFMKKIKIGVKVYDESHLNFANILLIDFFSNTKKTFYLTATFDRSDKTESQCFKRCFQMINTFGEKESLEIQRKHVLYYIVNINSNISMKDRTKLMGYPGFTSFKYGSYAFMNDNNTITYDTILKIIQKFDNVDGKILVFVPTIESVEKIYSKLKQDISYKSIGQYHSKIDKEEKEATLKKDIIVSTEKSLGTGTDIKGLRCVILGIPIASKVLAQQMIGRLREFAPDKDTFFFDIVDICIPPCNWYFNARFKKIKTLVKKVTYLEM